MDSVWLQRARKWPKKDQNVARKVQVAGGDCYHSGGQGCATIEDLSKGNRSGYLASSKVAHQCQKMARKAAVDVRNFEQNIISGVTVVVQVVVTSVGR